MTFFSVAMNSADVELVSASVIGAANVGGSRCQCSTGQR